MAAPGKAVIHGEKTGAGKPASRLTEAPGGHEKDVPRKNVSGVREFHAFHGELTKRAAKPADDAGIGNLRKMALSCGRVLETCASRHAKSRDGPREPSHAGEGSPAPPSFTLRISRRSDGMILRKSDTTQ